MLNLTDGSFLWGEERGNYLAPFPQNLSADVLVVGMGISGALAAHKLLALGYHVTLVDARPPASGSTLASTAIIQYELDVPLFELESKIAKADAQYVYRQSLASVEALFEIMTGLKQDFGQRRVPTVCLGYSAEECDYLKKEYLAQKSAGFEVELLSKSELHNLYPWTAKAALYNKNGGYVDPVKLTLALLENAKSGGAELYEGMLESYEDLGESVVLRFKGNRKVSCRYLVLAGGYELKRFLGLEAGKLTSSYAAATPAQAAIHKWDDEAVVWEVRQPYFYLRRTPDKRIIIGGRDKAFRNSFLRNVILPYEQYKLRKQAQEMLDAPELSIEHMWCGTFAESDDGMPFIGNLPEEKNVFIIFAAGGNGTTFAVLAAQMLSEWLLGTKSRLHTLFSIDRAA